MVKSQYYSIAHYEGYPSMTARKLRMDICSIIILCHFRFICSQIIHSYINVSQLNVCVLCMHIVLSVVQSSFVHMIQSVVLCQHLYNFVWYVCSMQSSFGTKYCSFMQHNYITFSFLIPTIHLTTSHSTYSRYVSITYSFSQCYLAK